MTDLIEVHATIRGGSCPDDHHYLLHAAIKTQCCRRLTERGWQLRTIQGGTSRKREGVRILEGADPALSLRLPKDDLGKCLSLEDAPLRLGDHILLVESPQVSPVRPASNLVADCVYQKHNTRGPVGLGRGDLGAKVGKELGAAFGHTKFGIAIQDHVRFQARGTQLHGNRVTVMGLSDEESLWVQRHGVGQKQSWGCGTFWPE